MERSPDQALIEQYREELLRMYRSANPGVTMPNTAPFTTVPRTSGDDSSPFVRPPSGSPQRPIVPDTVPAPRPQPEEEPDESTGQLVVKASTLRGSNPVPGANVTVFTGSPNDRTVIERSSTDSSGRTKEFNLPTPPKRISLSPGATERPYTLYNTSVLADGYVEHIKMNIPVFPGVSSLQTVDLILIPAAGGSTEPRIFDDFLPYNL